MKLIKTILIFIYVTKVYATPVTIDVIFLSEEKKETSYHILDSFNKKIFMSTAEGKSKCVPMGDGCFHPQLGYVEGKTGVGIVEQQSEIQKDVKLKTINSLDTNMIDCKKGNYFDIFCGKAKKEKHGPEDYEIWIDTSASVRRVDWSKDKSHCARRTFIENLQRKCNINVHTFDTSIKQMGGLENLCLTYGLNDQNRMIQWIKDSNAKHLIVITDIDEASIKLRNFLNSIGANIHGADYGDFSGSKLISSYVDKLTKSCQSKKK